MRATQGGFGDAQSRRTFREHVHADTHVRTRCVGGEVVPVLRALGGRRGGRRLSDSSVKLVSDRVKDRTCTIQPSRQWMELPLCRGPSTPRHPRLPRDMYRRRAGGAVARATTATSPWRFRRTFCRRFRRCRPLVPLAHRRAAQGITPSRHAAARRVKH